VDREAEWEFDRLRRINRSIWNAGLTLMGTLKEDPLTVGLECDPPLEGARKTWFWNPDYRMVWFPDQERHEVVIVGSGFKGRDSAFYPRLEERWQRRQDQEDEASREQGETEGS
jgi:hypothetical protein